MRLSFAILAAVAVAAFALPAEAIAPVRGVVQGTAEVATGAARGTAQVGRGLVNGTVTAATGTGRGVLCIVTLGIRCGPPAP
jgi:hypothetical protein